MAGPSKGCQSGSWWTTEANGQQPMPSDQSHASPGCAPDLPPRPRIADDHGHQLVGPSQSPRRAVTPGVGGKASRHLPPLDGRGSLQHRHGLHLGGLWEEIEGRQLDQTHSMRGQDIEVASERLGSAGHVHNPAHPTGHRGKHRRDCTSPRRIQDGYLSALHELWSVQDVFDPTLNHTQVARCPLARRPYRSRDFLHRDHPTARITGQHSTIGSHTRVQVEDPTGVSHPFSNHLMKLACVVRIDLEERSRMHVQLGLPDALDEPLTTGNHPWRSPHDLLSGPVCTTHRHTDQRRHRAHQGPRCARTAIQLAAPAGQHSLKRTRVIGDPKVEGVHALSTVEPPKDLRQGSAESIGEDSAVRGMYDVSRPRMPQPDSGAMHRPLDGKLESVPIAFGSGRGSDPEAGQIDPFDGVGVPTKRSSQPGGLGDQLFLSGPIQLRAARTGGMVNTVHADSKGGAGPPPGARTEQAPECGLLQGSRSTDTHWGWADVPPGHSVSCFPPHPMGNPMG